MDYLAYIDKLINYYQSSLPVQFLVSGDENIQKLFLDDVLRECHRQRYELVIVDDTGGTMELKTIRSYGYTIKNGLAGCGLYNPFQTKSLPDISRIRTLLAVLQWDERQKQKLISYLTFISHLEYLDGEGGELSLEKLTEYSAYEVVAQKIHDMEIRGTIDENQAFLLLGKYSECCASAADIEDYFCLLKPFVATETERQTSCGCDRQAVVFEIGKLGQDEVLKNMIAQLLKFSLQEREEKQVTVLFFDKGYGDREALYQLVTELPPHIPVHVFSKDIFTISDKTRLTEILNRFPAKIYGRHNMSSAKILESELGQIDIVKTTYCEQYDRRLRNNTPWDVLFKRNKSESYTTLAPVTEALFRKEMISELLQNQFILDIYGNKSMFVL